MSDQTISLPELKVEATRPETPTPPSGGGGEPAGAVASGPTPPDDELTLTVAGKVFKGWDSVALQRSCEQVPSSFSISLTERYPNEVAAVVIEPGLPCTVKMGKDLVLTGFIDRYSPGLSARTHSVRIMGRSKVQDLVDCSAVFDSFQISGQTVGQIATLLAKPYGISVILPDGPGPLVSQINLQLGETVRDVLERLCAFAKFLYYDDPDGNLVLRPVSTEKHATGIKQGRNLLAAAIEFSMDQRFSEYEVYPLSVLPLMQAETSAGGSTLPYPIGVAVDQTVKRFRRRIIILEHSGSAPLSDLARDRAEWEQGRRAGRSECVTVVVDSWRDGKGLLWEPNRLVNVDIPSCKVMDQTWIIGSVTYQRSADGGTTAQLTIMPPRAFAPLYDPLVPFNWQLKEAAERAAGSDPANLQNVRRGEQTGGV